MTCYTSLHTLYLKIRKNPHPDYTFHRIPFSIVIFKIQFIYVKKLMLVHTDAMFFADKLFSEVDAKQTVIGMDYSRVT